MLLAPLQGHGLWDGKTPFQPTTDLSSDTGLIGTLTNSLIENLPTAGVALIRFDIKSWKQVAQQSGNLEWFDFPKSKD
jgi:hypothetical protein